MAESSQLARVATPAEAGGRSLAREPARLPSERRHQPVGPVRDAQLTGVMARPAARRRRRFPLKSLLFLLVVVVPTALSATYFLKYASDQYVAESRFGLRTAELPKTDPTLMLSSLTVASQIGVDSNVVVQYAQSRQVVDMLERSVGLRAMYERPDIDPLSRLSPEASAEEVVSYWRGKVDPFFDQTTGTISLRVKAFTARDALKLNEEVLRLAEGLVNEMSRRTREDAVRTSQETVDKAEERLRKVRAELLALRDRSRILDAKKQSESTIGLIAKIREELARSRADLASQRFYLNERAPSVVALQSKIRGLEQQVAAMETQLSEGDATPRAESSRTVGSFENLEAERLMAEKSYGLALDALTKMQEVANRQAVYFSVFVRPALPEEALYPKRYQSILLTFLAAFGAWILIILGLHSIRDHA